MPISNYDTRPAPPPLFGSQHPEKPSGFRMLTVAAAWLLGTAAAVLTGWWAWVTIDLWAYGSDDASGVHAALWTLGIASLVLWAVTIGLVRLWRRA